MGGGAHGTGRGGGRRRTRTLSAPEEALWREVTRSIRPLAPAPAPEPKPPAAVAAPPAKDEPPPAPGKPKTVAVPAAARPRPEPPAGHGRAVPDIDRRTRRKLSRGAARIEARIDLHGRTQEEAHRRLRAFLLEAQASGIAHVLVITGKGSSGSEPGERGVLKRVVPEWLSQPAFRRLVAGFGEAHRSHGGEGALYVRVRRSPRTGSRG